MARIYLDARNITEQPAGVARYAIQLIEELARIATQHELIVVRHASNREPIEARVREVFLDRAIDGMSNYAFGARDLTKIFARLGEPDLYHDLFHVLPRSLPETLKIVVTLHDLIWIDHARTSQKTLASALAIRSFAGHAIPYALRRADHVICVSEPTARRAAPWLDRTPHTVISHGVGARFFEPPPEPDVIVDYLREDGRPYVVAIGNDKPYKNLSRLIRAFERAHADVAPARLALIGNCERLDTSHPDVVPLGFLSDEDLRRVLGHAALFVCPSLVEGFGLPILEAMALGVPCAVSDLEPMKSVAADAALHFAPTDIEALAEIIRLVLRRDDLREGLREQGRRHASRFTWRATAEQTLEVYERVLAE